jgi:murein DD-endopeptidase MepM/ murein hydrolase activator NlpD
MRRIRRSQRLALILKVYWRTIRVHQAWRLVSQAVMVLVLAAAVLAVWNAFRLNQNVSGAARSATLDETWLANAELADDLIPLHSAGTRVIETSSAAGSETTAVTEPMASESAETAESASTEKTAVFPGIDSKVTKLWSFPLKTEPYTPDAGQFGTRRTSKRIHAGIDLYAPSGTAVYAMASGRVSSIDVFYQGLKDIAIVNDDGTTIRYCELAPLVKVGDLVSQGQKIAKLRRNYDGTCMLHLEIYASASSQALTQTGNARDYLYVPAESKSYLRRRDLVDPSAVYSLKRP